MPTIVTDAPTQSTPLEVPRKKWTRAECEALASCGLWDQQKLELITGELITKMGKKRPHSNVFALLNVWLVGVFGSLVNPETPIDVAPEDNPTNEPEPDFIVLNRPLSQFQAGNPKPEDLALVVEVADSTLRFDLSIKAALYARAEIREYWVADVAGRRMIVHREPAGGIYRSVTAYSEEESLSPLARPEAMLTVREIFPIAR
jgi:Uma2 family endonuclease